MACNDYYSKQNSIKIRNVLNEKRKNVKKKLDQKKN